MKAVLRKNIVLSMALGFFGFLLIGTYIPAATAAEKNIVLKLSSYLPESTNESQIAQWWGKEIEKRTNSAVQFEYFLPNL